MNFRVTRSFEKKLRKLADKDLQLKKSLVKQFTVFSKNPNHPSLRLHKLMGKRSEQYAIWIKGNLRALSVKSENIYIFFDLITHDQY